MGLEQAQRQAMLPPHAEVLSGTLLKTEISDPATNPQLEALLDTVARHDPGALRQALSHALLRMELGSFVTDLAAPLTTAVGQAWAQGRFDVFEEHLYTDIITGVLRRGICELPPAQQQNGPKVLLTTLPPELHGLGLLMVEALLALQGCVCVSLGTQTPLDDIVRAAAAYQTDVVALSFSNLHQAAVVHADLRLLRARLPVTTELWVGGSCSALYQRPLAGISAVNDLAGVAPLVAQWRSTH